MFTVKSQPRFHGHENEVELNPSLLSAGHEHARPQNISDVLFHWEESHNPELPCGNDAKFQPFRWRAELSKQR